MTARQGVTLMCYWDGRMTNGPRGISYEGAAPKPIRVNYGVTHNELLDKMYGITALNKQQFKLRIICRYPACREYIAVPIDDDESIDIMFDVARQPGTNCLELYLEKTPNCASNQVIVSTTMEKTPNCADNQVDVSATPEKTPNCADNQVYVSATMEKTPICGDDQVDVSAATAKRPICVDNQVDVSATMDKTPICVDNQVDVSATMEKTPICTDNQLDVSAPIDMNNQASADGTAHDESAESFLDPGPIDNSVLVLQQQHRSEAIWARQDTGVLKCRPRLGAVMREWQLDPRIRRFVIQSGFYGLYRVGYVPLDWPLITALVERWRQETHTFHLVVGEVTITLQDVAVLLGLNIHGPAVSGTCDLQWDNLCEELLGVKPDHGAIHGSTLKLSWLRDNFRELPHNADEVTLQQYARAYILALIGSLVFTDKSGADVQLIFLPLLKDFSSTRQFSWGSAALGYLYRELCRASRKGANEIAGPLFLLQLWAWERLHIGHPDKLGAPPRNSIIEGKVVADTVPSQGDGIIQEDSLPGDPLGCRWSSPQIRRDNPQRALIFYRDQLDQQRDNQIKWQPYTPELLASLPDMCTSNKKLWRTVAPLVCFDIVEWHRPDRVLRQFGLRQGIPENCDTEVALHAIDKRGRYHYDWQRYHARYIELWNAREETIVAGVPEEWPMNYHDPYMEWYRSITRRFITPLNPRPHMRFQPTSGSMHVLIRSLTTIYRRCTTILGSFYTDDAKRTLEDIQMMCARALETVGEGQHIDRGPELPTTLAVDTMRGLQQHDDGMAGILQPSSETISPLHAPVLGKGKAPSVRGQVRGKGRGREHGTTSIIIATSPSPSLQAEPAGRVASQLIDMNETLVINTAGQVASSAPQGQAIFSPVPPGELSEAESCQATMPKKKKSKNL